MNGYDQRSLAFMKEARQMKRMPEAATTKPSRPRATVGPDMTEAISTEDLAMLLTIFQPRGKDGWDHEDWDHGPSGDADMCEAPLSTRARNRLPRSAFAIPEDRAYPINDLSHARNALARVSQFGSDEEKRRVRNAVYRRYPQLNPDRRNSSRRAS